MGTFGGYSLNDTGEKMVYAFEFIFVFSMFKKFLTDFKPDGSQTPVTDLRKIANRYFHDGFVLDLLMVLPFAYMFGGASKRNSKLAYFIKVYRLVKGLRIFNVSKMIQGIQEGNMKRMKETIRNDPKIGEDQKNDRNKIEEMLMFGYLLKTLKLVTMILNISFFVGIIFYVFCDLQG